MDLAEVVFIEVINHLLDEVLLKLFLLVDVGGDLQDATLN